jgi:CheY-like chemotaxis protein
MATDPLDAALVERDGRTVYSVAGRQGESDPPAPPSRPEPPRQTSPPPPAHWQTQIAPRPATAAAWALGEPEVAEPEVAEPEVTQPEVTEPEPTAGARTPPFAPPADAAISHEASEPPPAPIAAPPVIYPAVASHPAPAPTPPSPWLASEAAVPPPPITEPVAVEQYEVWQSVTTTDEEAVPATDGATGGAAAASAYEAWGQVTTTPAAGDGTAPAPVAELPTPAPPPVPEAVADGGDGPDILLVEDDQNVGKVYRLLMESKGFAVRHALDGVAGLELARARKPDLILLDVMMPRMNGILFLQSLRAELRLRDVPVVILSNFREPRLVERALALGAIEYIVKAQTRPDAMLAAIPRWLKGERALST